MIELDGSYAEGGGAIIRVGLALSTVTGKPFRAINIRKGRNMPGLKAQHVHCVKALQQLCNASVKDNYIGSTALTYEPGKISGKNITVDVGTAGSVTLVLQSLVIPSLFSSGVRMQIKGGTDVKWSSQVDYFSEVFLPHIRRYSEKAVFTLKKRGYYPKGGGEIELYVKKGQIKGTLDLTENGKLMQIKGISHASSDLSKQEVAERQAASASSILRSSGIPLFVRTEYQETLSTGSGITLWAIFSKREDDLDIVNPIILGSDVLGEKGRKAEDIGKEAGERLLGLLNSGMPADPFLADQLIPFIALFGGAIRASEITMHTRANIYVCEQFLGKIFEVDEGRRIIRSKGQIAF